MADDKDTRYSQVVPARAPQRISWKDPNYAKTGNAVSKSTASSTTAQKERALSGSRKVDRRTASQKSADSGENRRFRNKAAADRNTSTTKVTTPAEVDRDADLRALLGGGGGGSRRAYSDAEVAATSAKLQALYNRYAADIAAREADIAGYYDKSGANLGSIYDTSSGNVSKAYEAARAAQTQQLLALGMTEQTPVSQFGNETASVTSLNNIRAAVLAQNEASKGKAITNQRLASEAAQREGAQAAAQAAQQMASEMVSTGGGGGGLTPYQYAQMVLQRDKAESDNQYRAAQMAAQSAPATPVNWQNLINNVAGAKDLTSAQASLIGTMAKYPSNG